MAVSSRTATQEAIIEIPASLGQDKKDVLRSPDIVLLKLEEVEKKILALLLREQKPMAVRTILNTLNPEPTKPIKEPFKKIPAHQQVIAPPNLFEFDKPVSYNKVRWAIKSLYEIGLIQKRVSSYKKAKEIWHVSEWYYELWLKRREEILREAAEYKKEKIFEVFRAKYPYPLRIFYNIFLHDKV